MSFQINRRVNRDIRVSRRTVPLAARGSWYARVLARGTAKRRARQFALEEHTSYYVRRRRAHPLGTESEPKLELSFRTKKIKKPTIGRSPLP